jgi:hypothetical protein
MLIFLPEYVGRLLSGIHPIDRNFHSCLMFLYKFIYSFLELIGPLDGKSFTSRHHVDCFSMFPYQNFLFLFQLAHSSPRRLLILEYILYLMYNPRSSPLNVSDSIFKLRLLGRNATLSFFKG